MGNSSLKVTVVREDKMFGILHQGRIHCSVFLCDSNRRRNQAIFEKHVDGDTMKQLEMVAEQAQRFIEQVERAIDKRGSTLVILRDLANELDSMEKDVAIVRVTSSSAAVAGQLWQ